MFKFITGLFVSAWRAKMLAALLFTLTGLLVAFNGGTPHVQSTTYAAAALTIPFFAVALAVQFFAFSLRLDGILLLLYAVMQLAMRFMTGTNLHLVSIGLSVVLGIYLLSRVPLTD